MDSDDNEYQIDPELQLPEMLEFLRKVQNNPAGMDIELVKAVLERCADLKKQNVEKFHSKKQNFMKSMYR